jgi:predicted DNA-binding protein (MmcQ/YjbR family)
VYAWKTPAQHLPRWCRLSIRSGETPLTYDEFNRFCGALPATTYVVQWGGAHVWKVGGKVFAIGGWGDGQPAYTFKAGELSYEVLRDQPGLRPAPYLASRGLKWIQHYAAPGLADEDLKDYLRQSHHLVAQGLSKKKRRTLGLGPA